jgi:mRNA interferase MazF
VRKTASGTPTERRPLKRGEVILLPFPFNDLQNVKTRPALVLSSESFNRKSNSIIVAQITSNLKSGFKGLNVLIVDEDLDRYSGTRPIIPSIVKPYMVFSVNKRMAIKRIGLLRREKLAEVYKSLMKVFNLQ